MIARVVGVFGIVFCACSVLAQRPTANLELKISTGSVTATSSLANTAESSVGWLNVFTDISTAAIFVDGQDVGRESIVKYALIPGEHYVQVKVGESTAYAKTAMVTANRTTTVVSDHFVDFITKTPSRGAIDREARRLRESRGNFGIGFAALAIPQPAASIKWWPFPNVGVQALGLGNIPDSKYGGVVGGRVFFSPGDKVFQDDVMYGYGFLGGGTTYINGQFVKNQYYEFGIGVEAKLGVLAQHLFSVKYFLNNNISTGETKSDGGDFIRDALFVGALSLFYTSAEISIINQGNGKFDTSVGLALHVYF